MRLSEGVEWALHSCVTLAWLDAEAPVPAATIAEIHDLPTAYLTKQMQALVRAGIVTSSSGRRGGFRLARPATEITVLEIVDAIEGGQAGFFECSELRQRGLGQDAPPGCYDAPCTIAAVMHAAEQRWRDELARHTLASIDRGIRRAVPGSDDATRVWLRSRS
ncbi:MAG: Rrf2 family transcriptional regulator [Actinomycetota bacterium]